MTDEADVTRLASAWRSKLELQESQASRVREYQPPYDHWAPLAEMFSPGPVTPDIETVLAAVEPEETWLDIGCGAGRFTAHLAERAGRVVAVDGSAAMTERLREAARERGLENVNVLPASPWPLETVGEPVDVAFSSHVLYFVPAIMPFLLGMEAHARRRCFVLLGDEAGSLPPEEAWRAAHDEPMSRLPALDDFEALTRARGIDLQVKDVPIAEPAEEPDPEQVFTMLRSKCLLREDSPKAVRLRRWFDEQREATGKTPSLMAMRRMALCSWEPPSE